MQRLKMKKNLLCVILLIASIATSCTSTLPKKPQITVCVFYSEDMGATIVNAEDETFTLSFDALNGSMLFPAADWAEYAAWVESIHSYAKRSEPCN